MKIDWITDIHLIFLEFADRKRFYQDIIATKSIAVLVSDDIAEAPTVSDILKEMSQHIAKPIYFVLGNHDYYQSSVENVRQIVTQLSQDNPSVNWLPETGLVQLSKDTLLLGEDCWADGRYGNYVDSRVMLNDISYKLLVSLPEGYDMKDNHSYRKNYQVVYLLDPDIEFAMLESISWTMVNYDTIEPFIIVGIGYDNQDLAAMNPKEGDQQTKNRARDYIPIKVQQGKEDFEGGDHEYSGLSDLAGGSAKFKKFIEKELIPYISQKYRVSNKRTLVGHSQAGLFSSWMMLEYPNIFEKCIVLSPSLWVEKGQMLKQSNRIKSLGKIIAYFAVGSQEHDEKGSLVNDLKTFYNSLHKPEGSNLKLEIIYDENYVSMVPISLTRGLKYLFGK